MTSSTRRLAALVVLSLGVAACGSTADDTVADTSVSTTPVDSPADTVAIPSDTEAGTEATSAAETESAVSTATDEAGTTTDDVTSTFVAEVWADNWFSLSVNGVLVGEDSVPITTERSFNAETISFEATYPLTIAIEAKDFKDTDSGLEYIGEGNQQMGDRGIIVQITDSETGDVVAVSDGSWSALVVHRAPLDVECETSLDPDTECEFEITETPAGWTEAAYDASAWPTATEWSEAAVSPKDGYDEIRWVGGAELIWGADLEVDNTILLRTTIS